MLLEDGIYGDHYSTYDPATNAISSNCQVCESLGFETQEEERSCISCILMPKLHDTPS